LKQLLESRIDDSTDELHESINESKDVHLAYWNHLVPVPTGNVDDVVKSHFLSTLTDEHTRLTQQENMLNSMAAKHHPEEMKQLMKLFYKREMDAEAAAEAASESASASAEDVDDVHDTIVDFEEGLGNHLHEAGMKPTTPESTAPEPAAPELA